MAKTTPTRNRIPMIPARMQLTMIAAIKFPKIILKIIIKKCEF